MGLNDWTIEPNAFNELRGNIFEVVYIVFIFIYLPPVSVPVHKYCIQMYSSHKNSII